jgi:RNA polymerase sigma-70 factor (ECF subfamily)
MAASGEATPDGEVELAARESYGRLLAWLTSRCGSIATAEDALADALAEAVKKWPEVGVPDNTEAWLLTVARRRLVDEQRRQSRHADAETKLRTAEQIRLTVAATEAAESPLGSGLPERRLELLFTCAHPDIPAAMRTPLMLQTVLGLTAEQIGSAMLVAPATIGQRLVRVKRRIVDDGIPFEVPGDESLPGRLHHVLDAVYAAYGIGYDDADDASQAAAGLAGEAIWLAGLLVQLLPDHAEPKGLYALLCLSEARRPARRDERGAFVPLEEQDPQRWDATLIESGEIALWRAAQQGQAGRFQIEASIQSMHADRRRTGTTDWRSIAQAYRLLVHTYPTLGAAIGYAAALGRTGAVDAGLTVLDGLDRGRVERHQPYWAVRAWVLAELGDAAGARIAYDRAIGLTADAAVRDWLVARSRPG